MIWILLIYQIFISHFSNGEDPKFVCPDQRPYRNSINKCSDFIDICVKKDDIDCNNFQNACQQCPPSNYSIMMFIDIMKVKHELVTTKSQLQNLTIQVQSQATKTSQIFSLLLASLALFALTILIIVLEVRFKIFSRYKKISSRNFNRADDENDMASSKQLIPCKVENDNLINTIKEFEESFKQNLDIVFHKIVDLTKQNFDSKVNEILQRIDDVITSLSTKFMFQGYDKPFDYKINKKDSVVKVKKELCDRFLKDKNYKTMKMFYKDNLLVDNEYFSNQLKSLNVTIDCVFDTNINPNDILVLKLLGNIDVPEYLQINKNQTITDLKIIFNNLRIIEEIKIFNNSKELETEFPLKSMKDYDRLYVINTKPEELTISSTFIKGNTCVVQYKPAETIRNMITDIAYQFNSEYENFFIFLKNQYLDEGKYLFHYDMNHKADLHYCCFKKFIGFTNLKSICQEPFYELFKAKDNQNKSILLKKYSSRENSVKENKYILKELATFQIIKSSNRFVHLLDVYKDKSINYVAMENMEKGTIFNILKGNNPIEITIISKWASQILDGLIFLHQNKIIYRAFCPSCILVDKDDNIKLHSLNLSKYTNIDKPSSLFTDYKMEELPINYLSPEIFEDKQYTELTDIWSFGAVLIFISTGKDPLNNYVKNKKLEPLNNDEKNKKLEPLNNDEKNKKLDPNLKFKYQNQIPDQYKNSKLSEFIDSCLKYNPKERSPCSNLKNHDFLKIKK